MTLTQRLLVHMREVNQGGPHYRRNWICSTFYSAIILDYDLRILIFSAYEAFVHRKMIHQELKTKIISSGFKSCLKISLIFFDNWSGIFYNCIINTKLRLLLSKSYLILAIHWCDQSSLTTISSIHKRAQRLKRCLDSQWD